MALGLTEARVARASALAHASGGGVEQHLAVTCEFEGGAIGAVSGGSGHAAALRGKHSLELRVIGSEGQLLLDFERECLRVGDASGVQEVFFADGSGTYDCRGPIEAVLDAARGVAVDNTAPGELGARAVEALELAYRSVSRGVFASRPIVEG